MSGVAPSNSICTYRKFLNDPLGASDHDWMAEYRRRHSLHESGDRHQYMIANPDMIREVLVQAIGYIHQRS